MTDLAPAPALVTVRVDFVADVICPWCYVGWRRMLLALAMRPHVKPQFVWQPYQLDPNRGPEGSDRMARMRELLPAPGALEASFAKFKAIGDEIGLDIRTDKVLISPNTTDAHRVVVWAGRAGLQAEGIETMMAAFWTQLRDLRDPQVLADVAAEIGLDRDDVLAKLATDLDKDTVIRSQQAAQNAGVSGVPCIVFDGHLAALGADTPENLVQKLDMVLAKKIK